MHARAAGAGASLLANGIQFIKDDDMEAAVGSQLVTGRVKTDKSCSALKNTNLV